MSPWHHSYCFDTTSVFFILQVTTKETVMQSFQLTRILKTRKEEKGKSESRKYQCIILVYITGNERKFYLVKVLQLPVHISIHGSTELPWKLYFLMSGAIRKDQEHTVPCHIPHVGVTVKQIFIDTQTTEVMIQ